MHVSEDRDYHTLFWSADAEAATAITLATEALGRDLRALVREHAEEPVERVFLLWTEQLCLGVAPSPERAGPPGESGPEPLPVQVGARYASKVAPNLTTAGPPCIYLYLDFPTFFKAWFAWRKRARKPRSAAWIAKRLGCRGPWRTT